MLDPTSLLQGVGALAGVLIIGAIIFAESGLLLGFFLPGDTLLFTAGFFAAQGELPLAGVLLAIFLGAFIGDNVGYTIGKKTGPRMFRKKDGIVFRQEYILRAERFYEKHGGKTVIFARFIPVVRTFAPIVAGIGNMDRKKFMLYNVVGAAIWTLSVTMLGYWLGSLVDPHTMERYIIAAIGGALLITVGPTLYHLAREERLRAFVRVQFKRVFKRYEKAASEPDNK